MINEITGRSVFAKCVKDGDTVSGSENTWVVDQAYAGEGLVLPCKVFLWSSGLHLWPCWKQIGQLRSEAALSSCAAVLVSWVRNLVVSLLFFLIFLMLVSWLQAEEGGAVAEDSWRKSSSRRGRSSQTRSREKTEGCRGGAGKRRTAAPTGRRERTEGERRAGAHSETSMLLWWNFCASLVGSEVVEQHLLCSTYMRGMSKIKCCVESE